MGNEYEAGDLCFLNFVLLCYLFFWFSKLIFSWSVMMAVTSSCKDKFGMDSGKYVRYTPEQVEALERLYHECPKPSSLRRQQLIRECPILSNIEPKQIKVWFQNRRYWESSFVLIFWVLIILENIVIKMVIVLCSCKCRCREKQRKESSRLQGVNRKLTAMNKLLMEENDRLQKQVSQLVYENSFFRQQTQTVKQSVLIIQLNVSMLKN